LDLDGARGRSYGGNNSNVTMKAPGDCVYNTIKGGREKKHIKHMESRGKKVAVKGKASRSKKHPLQGVGGTEK